MGSLASPLATLGILSIGDMGLGIARLLLANNFKVITNASDRSQTTQARAKDNSIDLVSNDIDLCNQSDYVLSIVPPRDAIATAKRIVDASSSKTLKQRSNPLYFLDLNAISPKSARTIDDLITSSNTNIHFIDGGIIGGPPQRKDNNSWTRPSIPTSGPHQLSSLQPAGNVLGPILNIKHINSRIGSASGLKMCFASLTKGYTALAIQSFTTASQLNILPELKLQMEEFNPSGLKNAERSLPAMCPKAYRWVHEMREIGETFEADGGFDANENVFGGVAEVYRFVAEGTELGGEVVGSRVRGKDVEDVARSIGEGARRRKEKTE